MATGLSKTGGSWGDGKACSRKKPEKRAGFQRERESVSPAFDWECDPESLTRYPDNEYLALKDVIAEYIPPET